MWLVRKRKPASDSWELAGHSQLGLGVLLLDTNNFIEHQHQTKQLSWWWVKTKEIHFFVIKSEIRQKREHHPNRKVFGYFCETKKALIQQSKNREPADECFRSHLWQQVSSHTLTAQRIIKATCSTIQYKARCTTHTEDVQLTQRLPPLGQSCSTGASTCWMSGLASRQHDPRQPSSQGRR